MPEVKVCSESEIPSEGSKCFEIAEPELKLAVVRTSNDSIHVVDDTCSHADYSLSEGEVDSDELTIECPKHGALFSLISGEPESLPATKPIKTYSNRIHDGALYVELKDDE